MTAIRQRARGVGPAHESAFTLLEVMIAMALFFMAIFAILGLTSQSIGAAARLLAHPARDGWTRAGRGRAGRAADYSVLAR